MNADALYVQIRRAQNHAQKKAREFAVYETDVKQFEDALDTRHSALRLALLHLTNAIAAEAKAEGLHPTRQVAHRNRMRTELEEVMRLCRKARTY